MGVRMAEGSFVWLVGDVADTWSGDRSVEGWWWADCLPLLEEDEREFELCGRQIACCHHWEAERGLAIVWWAYCCHITSAGETGLDILKHSQHGVDLARPPR